MLILHREMDYIVIIRFNLVAVSFCWIISFWIIFNFILIIFACFIWLFLEREQHLTIVQHQFFFCSSPNTGLLLLIFSRSLYLYYLFNLLSYQSTFSSRSSPPHFPLKCLFFLLPLFYFSLTSKLKMHKHAHNNLILSSSH